MREASFVPLREALSVPAFRKLSARELLGLARRHAEEAVHVLRPVPGVKARPREVWVSMRSLEPIRVFSPRGISFLAALAAWPASRKEAGKLLADHGLLSRKKASAAKAVSKALANLNRLGKTLGWERTVHWARLEGAKRIYIVLHPVARSLNLSPPEAFESILGPQYRKFYELVKESRSVDGGQLARHVGLSSSLRNPGGILRGIASSINHLHNAVYGRPAISVSKYGEGGPQRRNRFSFEGGAGQQRQIADYFRGQKEKIVRLIAENPGISSAELKSNLGISTRTLMEHIDSIARTRVAGPQHPLILRGASYRKGSRFILSPGFLLPLGPQGP